MSSLATAYVAIKADIKQLKTGLDRAYDEVHKSGKKMESALGRINKAVMGIGIAFGGLAAGAGMSSLVSSSIRVAANFEQMQIKLNALTGGRGKDTLEALNKIALDLPINTQQAIDAFVKMQAMGVDPTEKKLRTLIDTASIFGSEVLPRVSRALGQMSALGKLSAEELNQLSEVGINARKYLSQAFGGKTVEEIQKSGIAIQEIIDAIWKGLDADYSGAAKAAMQSWQGLTATFESYWIELQRKMTNLDILKKGLGEINSLLKHTVENFENLVRPIELFGIALIDLGGRVKISFTAMVDIVYNAIKKAVKYLYEMIIDIETTLGRLLIKAAGIIPGADATVGMGMIKHAGRLRSTIQKTEIEDFTDTLNKANNALIEHEKIIISMVEDAYKPLNLWVDKLDDTLQVDLSRTGKMFKSMRDDAGDLSVSIQECDKNLEKIVGNTKDWSESAQKIQDAFSGWGSSLFFMRGSNFVGPPTEEQLLGQEQAAEYSTMVAAQIGITIFNALQQEDWASIGGAIGGGIGALAGPIGAMIGSAIGRLLGGSNPVKNISKGGMSTGDWVGLAVSPQTWLTNESFKSGGGLWGSGATSDVDFYYDFGGQGAWSKDWKEKDEAFGRWIDSELNIMTDIFFDDVADAFGAGVDEIMSGKPSQFHKDDLNELLKKLGIEGLGGAVSENFFETYGPELAEAFKNTPLFQLLDPTMQENIINQILAGEGEKAMERINELQELADVIASFGFTDLQADLAAINANFEALAETAKALRLSEEELNKIRIAGLEAVQQALINNLPFSVPEWESVLEKSGYWSDELRQQIAYLIYLGDYMKALADGNIQLATLIKDAFQIYMESFNKGSNTVISGIDRTVQRFADYTQVWNSAFGDQVEKDGLNYHEKKQMLEKITDLQEEMMDVIDPNAWMKRITDRYGIGMQDLTMSNISKALEMFLDPNLSQSFADLGEVGVQLGEDILQLTQYFKDAADNILEAISNTRQTLKYGDLNPFGSVANLAVSGANDEADLYRAALTGDQDAIQKYLSFVPTFLKTQQDKYKSSQTYQDIYSSVMAKGGKLDTIQGLVQNKGLKIDWTGINDTELTKNTGIIGTNTEAMENLLKDGMAVTVNQSPGFDSSALAKDATLGEIRNVLQDAFSGGLGGKPEYEAWIRKLGYEGEMDKAPLVAYQAAIAAVTVEAQATVQQKIASSMVNAISSIISNLNSQPINITVEVGGKEFDAYIVDIADQNRVKAERRNLGGTRIYG